jgi:hypothetical protein
MALPKCPSCKAEIKRVRPVVIESYSDSRHWKGPTPSVLGFACYECEVLLPVALPPPAESAAVREVASSQANLRSSTKAA